MSDVKVILSMTDYLELKNGGDCNEALAEIERQDGELAAYSRRAAIAEREIERLREALQRIYQQGRGPHVGIARDALNGGESDAR